MIIMGIFLAVTLVIFCVGIRIIRPTEKGLIETLGKYDKTANQGFSWIMPAIQRMVFVNITEQMVDVPPQKVITKDNLNAEVDAVVYYKVEDAKAAIYNVDNHQEQLSSLARTTLRAVIGTMTLTECNEKRKEINEAVEKVLDVETDRYGVNVLRVEIQRIEPPHDVQEAMNKVVKAEQAKRAAIDLASAAETQADGLRRATIKEAEGHKQGNILKAEGQAEAIKLVNEAAEKYFIGNAQELKKLETARDAVSHNSKIIMGSDLLGCLTNIIKK